MRKSILILLFFSLSRVLIAQDAEPTGDGFTKGTVWFNTEWPMNLDMFREKILVVAIWHPECIEARHRVLAMQDIIFNAPQVQMVSLFPGDSLHPVSRSEVNGYIQEMQLIHPVGIAPDFSGFKDINTSKLPVFLLYQQGIHPTLVSNEGSTDEEFVQTLQELVNDKTFLRTLPGWQAVPTVEPRFWADPLIELPTYVNASADAFPLFISEPAHNRIVVLNDNGSAQVTIGSQRGYQDGNFMSTHFAYPSGTSFNTLEQLLYIADTDNNRVRVADLSGRIVYNLMGNGALPKEKSINIDGPMQPIGLPTDVEYFDNKLYVLSGATNQLFEADPVSGKATEIVRFADTYWKNGRVRAYAKNLSVTKNGFFVVMSDGTVYNYAKKKLSKYYAPGSDYDRAAAVVERSKSIFVLLRDGNTIQVTRKKAAAEKLAGSGTKGWTDGQAQEASFNDATDMTYAANDLVICDHGNHLLRLVSPTSGKTTTLSILPQDDLVYSTDALNGGDPVIYDSLFVRKGENKLHVKFDMGDYTLVKEGRNQVFVNEGEGPTIESNDLTMEGIRCSFDTEKLPSGLLQFEMYMCVSSKSNPKLILMKRTFLNILLQDSESAERDQEIIYSPRLLPN